MHQSFACSLSKSVLYSCSQRWYNELTVTQKDERAGELITGIIQVEKDRRKYLDLLLLADEQEDMVDRYLERGDMFVLIGGTARAECAVTKEGSGVHELRNMVTALQFYRQGYGRRLIECVFIHYSDLRALYVGTGDSPLSLSFYHTYSFIDSHRVERFFTDNYDHPITGGGIQLVDVVYLKRGRDMA